MAGGKDNAPSTTDTPTSTRARDAVEMIGYVCLAVMVLAAGCAFWSAYAALQLALTAAVGEYADAQIVAIGHAEGRCTYSWSNADPVEADCPPRPDRGQTVSVFVDGEGAVHLTRSAAWEGARIGALVTLGAAVIAAGAWRVGAWSDDYLD